MTGIRVVKEKYPQNMLGLGKWKCKVRELPQRYKSPEMCYITAIQMFFRSPLQNRSVPVNTLELNVVHFASCWC